MQGRPPFQAGRPLALAVIWLVAGGCGPQARSTTTVPTTPAPGSWAADGDAATTTTAEASISARLSDDHGEQDGSEAVSPARRAELGLTAPAGTIPGLSAQQWSDAEAVASRFVLVDTTYAAAEDPAAVNARRSAYAAARLASDLGTSSSGGARLEELRRRQARLAGEVLTIATSQNTGQLAVVQITAAVTTTTVDRPPERRVRFYQLTLGRDSPTGRWLVARVEQS